MAEMTPRASPVRRGFVLALAVVIAALFTAIGSATYFGGSKAGRLFHLPEASPAQR